MQVEETTVEEIKKALKESKNKEAAGPGNIPIELVKCGPDILLVLDIVAELFNKCMIEADNISENWNLAYITIIFKKEDQKSITTIETSALRVRCGVCTAEY